MITWLSSTFQPHPSLANHRHSLMTAAFIALRQSESSVYGMVPNVGSLLCYLQAYNNSTAINGADFSEKRRPMMSAPFPGIFTFIERAIWVLAATGGSYFS
jgi:hypothetical protein